ncbi:uncharacterized protein [Panulirus ornatus]|uniref:uncharacterized protein n=1 Tax=Panulirus ornatus TaxID=150431 RepID=UPI003A86441B
MQTGGVARGDSGLTWRGNLTKVDDVSICFRVKVFQTRETNYVVSYSSRSSSNDIFVDVRLHQKEVRVGCCQDFVYNTFPFDVSLMTWIHLCLALDLGRGAMHFQTKGKPLVTQEGIRKPGARVTPGGVLMLGQDQDVVGGQTEASQSLHGYLGDLLIFDRVISVDEMTAFTTCAGGVDWDALVDFSEVEDNFVFGEATEVVELGYEDACSGIDAYVSLFPETRDFDVSHLFCRSLGGSIVLPRGSLENEMVTHLARKYCKGGRLWLGLEYTADRGYREYGTNNTVNYTNWDHAFRDDTQIRAVLYSKVTTAQKNWGISTRDRKLCTACGSDEPFSLRVRGLCADSKFDRQFLIHGYSSFKPSFLGWKSSHLSWVAYNATRDVFSGYWKMVVADEPHIHAEMVMENRYSYPIGTHAWKIHSDICSGDRKRLKFTTCGAGMFTCDDGSCVDVALRCDKRYDCVDFSDEERCNPVLIPEGYDKTLPPPFTTTYSRP